jgi:hypothetical protein
MEFVPGDPVPISGVYRAKHYDHRLMHEATLLGNALFPRCKQCGNAVQFHLVRPVFDNQVLPFRAHAFLEDYTEPKPPMAAAR